MDESKYENKNILILGGGTSTLDTKWENLDVDYIWTCNDFYKLDRINRKKIDLVTLGFNTDLGNKKLIDKLKKDSPTVAIEPIHFRHKKNSNKFKEFSNKFKVVEFNIPIETIAGAASRLILMALKMNPSKVYFSGIDGFNQSFTNKHAFTGHIGLKDSDTRRDYFIYYNGFTEFFRYLLNFDYSKLQNLGEGFDYNIGTEISSEYFPLSDTIKEKIR